MIGIGQEERCWWQEEGEDFIQSHFTDKDNQS